MDEEVGRFLDALESSGVADDTGEVERSDSKSIIPPFNTTNNLPLVASLFALVAIILHSDHGWQLGERGMWAKNTNWEAAVRVPLIISVPWMPSTHNTRSSELVELVDIMPTVAELADIPLPSSLGDKLNPPEGVSIVPSLSGSSVKSAAFSQYPRKPKDMNEPWKSNGIGHDEPETFLYMGYSIRVDEWRYTEWYPWDQENLKAQFFKGLYVRELYDWRGVDDEFMDYDEVENLNVAEHENNEGVIADLHLMLMEKFDI
jgi:iduronate 2-sulfatase